MSILKNKEFHGLPGLGATGQQGLSGAEGSSILFGYIEDFFDKEILSIDEFVRYGAKTSSGDISYFEDKINQYISEYITYLVKGEVFNSPTSSYVSQTIKLSEGPTEIVIPTTFSNLKTKVGDIIYIIEDDSEKGKIIKYMILVEESMFGQSFSNIINNYVVLSDPTVIKSFYFDNDRLSISEMYSPLRYETPPLLKDSIKQKYIQNFIKSNSKKEFVKIVSEYSSDNISSLESLITPNASLNKEIIDSSFLVSSKNNIKVPRFFINNDCISDIELDNIIVPKELSISNSQYIKGISENDFDITSGNIKVLFSQFFNVINSIEGYSYGALLYQVDSSVNVTKVSDYNFGNQSISYIDLMSLSPIGTSKYKIILYLNKENTTTYYSRPALITIHKTYIDKFVRYVIDAYTIEDGETLISDEVESGDTDYIDFSLDTLSSEEKDNVKFIIESREGYYIESISFNSIPIFKDDKDDIQEFSEDSGYWMNIKDVSTLFEGDNSSSKKYVLKFNDNLPNLSESENNPSTLDEYLTNFSIDNINENSKLFDILKNNISTLSRNILVTVVSKDSSTGTSKKSYYKIIQPGFKDFRVKPKIVFTPRIYNNDLEKSNNLESGVLCNQLQYFIDVDIKNFNAETWGKYKKDSKIDLYFTFNRFNKEKSDYTGNTVYNNNLLIYDYEFLKSLKNNAFRYKIEYLQDESITIESKDNDILNSKNYTKFETIVSNSGAVAIEPTSVTIDGSLYSSDWIYLNDKEITEFNFAFKDSLGVIKNIPCAKNGNNILHKIRVFIEFANPVPAELNINLALDKAVMHYEIDSKEIYFPISYENVVGGTSGTYIDFEAESGNNKFIFNPVYFTAAPKADEELVSLSFKPALKKCTGSIKEINLGLGLFGYDIIKSKYNIESEYDRLTRYYNYKDYFFKIQDFQDNIKSIYLSPVNIKDSSIQEKLNSDNDFKKLMRILSEPGNTALGYESFEDDERVNKFEESSYLSMVYNSNILLPKYEAENSIIDYNNKEYDGDNYSQFDNNAPIFLKEGFNLQIRSDEEIEAISGWNYEYESSKFFNKDFAIGGSSTISGNGYLHLPNNYGENLYDEEEIIPLEALRYEEKQEVFNSQKYLDTLQYSPIDNKFIPKDENYWRVPLWNLNWMVPVYKYNKENNFNYIIPYRFTNPYLMFLDRIVTEEIVKGKEYSDIIYNLGYITGSYQMSQYITDFLDNDGKAIYINAKYNNYNCIKLLDTLSKSDYNSSSIDDYDVSKIISAIIETSKKYEEEVKHYNTASDIPNNIIRWWKCIEALQIAYENPAEYDTNLSELQINSFKAELLDVAYSDDSINEDDNKKFDLEYYEKYTKKEDGLVSRNNFIPYNILYSIYPRIIYPQDKNRINVLMVQQPTISSEYENKLSKHYFSTLNYVDVYPDLSEPYQCLI